MHCKSIISVAIVAVGFFGEASAWCNWNKKTIGNCCYRDNDSRIRQGGKPAYFCTASQPTDRHVTFTRWWWRLQQS
ncbi:hypothetical protein Cob_v008040 [Colletotrichum orbiculare MAFF 240422]|uniref:Uncharacterized protein n=1 Tax=Colletotrichum orbiculare (strain 104-T / ATCC 96160 / CBS 514.97 / LARS 414 / MAFF 240422) TaxID=1213857 RepID=A0A484FMQ2_COLOR|nr:hypothetical protein Cob_v008040 [Colletotrichum orbiculare MAFF 240422]